MAETLAKGNGTHLEAVVIAEVRVVVIVARIHISSSCTAVVILRRGEAKKREWNTLRTRCSVI